MFRIRAERFLSVDRLFVSAVAFVPLLSIAALTACQPSTRNSGPATASGLPELAPVTLPNIEDYYTIGPETARSMGFNLAWQAETLTDRRSGIRMIVAQADSLFVLDGGNFLSRVRLTDGVSVWRLPVATMYEEILGIDFLPQRNRVYVTTGGALIVLDADNGALVGKQRFQIMANTDSSVFGPYMIYGGRNGQVIWHSHEVAFQWRAYQVSSAMGVTPQVVDGKVVAVGKGGHIMVLDAGNVTRFWGTKLLDDVTAAPAVNNEALFVAGRDQHLRAFDLHTGRVLWKRLFEAPLTDSPTLIGNALYQHVPGEGLLCFEAMPANTPGGKLRWTARNVAGNVLTRVGSTLYVWDSDRRVMTLLDAASGAAAQSLDLPRALRLIVTSVDRGDIYAANDDGRVVRLVPAK